MQPLTTNIRRRLKFIIFHLFDNEYSQVEKHGPIYPYEGSSNKFLIMYISLCFFPPLFNEIS
jgi:hypothetical protein